MKRLTILTSLVLIIAVGCAGQSLKSDPIVYATALYNKQVADYRAMFAAGGDKTTLENKREILVASWLVIRAYDLASHGQPPDAQFLNELDLAGKDKGWEGMWVLVLLDSIQKKTVTPELESYLMQTITNLEAK